MGAGSCGRQAYLGPPDRCLEESRRARESLAHWATRARSFVGVVVTEDGLAVLVSSMDDNRAAYTVLMEAAETVRPMAYADTLLMLGAQEPAPEEKIDGSEPLDA